jgi:calmodulin
MRELFRTFDKDNSGSITAAELRKAVSQLDGIGLMSVMEQREMMENLDAMINEADTDGDGTVDYEEFVAMMTKMNEAKAAA